MRRALVVCLAAAALAVRSAPSPAADSGGGPPEHRAKLVASVATGFPVSEQRLVDVDGDGKTDLLVVGVHGEVRVWRHDPKTGTLAAAPAGSLVLPAPDRSLLAIADLAGGGGPPQLVVMSRNGVEIHRVGPDGAYAADGEAVAPRARFPLRVGRPVFAEIARDVNGDGRPDLVLPAGDSCELWLNGGLDPATKLPSFTRAASIHVDMSRENETKGDALSDVLESSFRIPDLRFADVNGDGRPDLLVEEGKTRAVHLQRKDGTIPAEPDVKVDLSIFRDTTPEATVQLGHTLAGGDDQRMESRDLDGDGIPDYVISHRRKVWVFRGTHDGPQFKTPSQVLLVSDDVTAMMLLRLDADALPDLFLMRVEIPTVATLLKGLFSEFDVDVSALGYANAGGGRFEATPKWKGQVALRAPALLGVLRNPDAFIRKFEDAAKKFRNASTADFDGDGRRDAALVAEDGRALEFHLGRAAAPQDAGADAERALGDVFFGGSRKVWDVDAVLSWLGDAAQRQVARVTGGGDPVARWPFRAASGGFERTGVLAGDLDGDGRAEVVVA